MTETSILRAVQLAVTKAGARIFRNNLGQYEYAPGRYIRYGLANPGGSDLIGWYKGRFLAIEVKTPVGKVTIEQQRFIDAVNADGGIAFVARSENEALRKLREAVER